MEANWHRHYFSIADHRVGVFFREGQTNDLALIPSYEPFRTTEEEDCVMVMEVDDTLHPVPKDQRSRIRVFDTGNGDTAVDRLEDGGYQFIIKDIRGRACCLLIADKAFAHCRCALNGDGMMRSFGLNSALMLAYAFATGAARRYSSTPRWCATKGAAMLLSPRAARARARRWRCGCGAYRGVT